MLVCVIIESFKRTYFWQCALLETILGMGMVCVKGLVIVFTVMLILQRESRLKSLDEYSRRLNVNIRKNGLYERL